MRGTFSLILLVAFTMLAYAYKDWHPGFASAFIFYELLLILLYELALCMTMFHQLQVTRMVHKKRLFDGETQDIVIRIKRKYPVPFAWYTAVEKWPSGIRSAPSPIVFPWFRKEIEICYQLQGLSRGYYELTEIVVESGDLFGFFKGQRTYSLQGDFFVYPLFQKFNWYVKNGEKTGTDSVIQRSSPEFTSLAGIREYQHGDRLSQVHWKATARNMTLKTKEFESEAASNFLVFLDTDATAYPQPEQFERAVGVAASLFYSGSKRKLKFSLLCPGVNQLGNYMAGTSELDFYRFLECLATVQVGESSVAREIRSQAIDMSKGTHLVVVTGRMDRSLSVMLIHLAHSQRKVELFLITKDSLGAGEEWLQTLRRNGVICHCESA